MTDAKDAVLLGKGNRRVRLLDEPDGDYVTYGSWRDAHDGEWLQVQYLSGSYYSGGFVCKANYEVFCEEFLEDGDGAKDGWCLHTPGGHQTYGILLHVERTPLEVWERLASLADYPCLDDERVSQLEFEETDETWENCMRSDWIRMCAERFAFDADEPPPDIDWRAHFEEACKDANVYWESQGNEQSMWVDLKRALRHAEHPGAFKVSHV